MVRMIEMQFQHGSIEMDIVNDLGWCRVFLNNDSRICLGADSFQIICKRLLSALIGDADIKSLREYFGEKIYWVTSLSEAHAAVYSTIRNDIGLKLFCIEDESFISHEITLSEYDIANWIQMLESVIE